jgi:hypothetical protein
MTALLMNRWVWVAGLWTGALFLFFWNHHAIDRVLAIQAQNHGLRSELTFQQQAAPKLERIQNEHSKLFLTADSIQLGVLAVEGLLGELASRSGLNVGQLTSAPIQKGAEAVGLALSLSGPLEGMLPFMAALTAHRYLQPKQVVVKLDPKTGEGLCELSVLLRCRLQASGGKESPPTAPKARAAL